MAQATLKLKKVKFIGDGPCGGSALDFRVGNQTIGSATITQPNTSVNFGGGASGTISGSCAIKAYQNGALRGSFAPGLNAGTSQPNGSSNATVGIFGGGKLRLEYSVTPL